MPNSFSRVMAFEKVCQLMGIQATERLLRKFHTLMRNKYDTHRVDLVGRRHCILILGFCDKPRDWKTNFFFARYNDLGSTTLHGFWKTLIDFSTILKSTPLSRCQLKNMMRTPAEAASGSWTYLHQDIYDGCWFEVRHLRRDFHHGKIIFLTLIILLFTFGIFVRIFF